MTAPFLPENNKPKSHPPSPLYILRTYHQEDWSKNILHVADGGHVEHAGHGVRGDIQPGVGEARLIPGPVRDVSYSRHAGRGDTLLIVYHAGGGGSRKGIHATTHTQVLLMASSTGAWTLPAQRTGEAAHITAACLVPGSLHSYFILLATKAASGMSPCRALLVRGEVGEHGTGVAGVPLLPGYVGHGVPGYYSLEG